MTGGTDIAVAEAPLFDPTAPLTASGSRHPYFTDTGYPPRS